MDRIYNEDTGKFEESNAVPVYFESPEDAIKVINLLTGEYLEWVDLRKEPENLPRPDERVLCCTQTAKGNINYVLGYRFKERWVCGMNSNVIAWIRIIPFEGDTDADTAES